MTRGILAPGALLAALAVAACAPKSTYQRPAVTLPATMPEASTAVGSLGDTAWPSVFTDEALRALIRTALERNDNLQLAAARLVEVQALAGIARADRYPTIIAGASELTQRTSSAFGFPSRTAPDVFTLQAAATWELDFWNRLKNLSTAARAQVLASTWAQRAVATAVVQQVAESYFRLTGLDATLEIATRTLATRRESLALVQVRERGGVTTLVDVRQAEQLVAAATHEIVSIKRAIAQEEHLMSVLLGGLPAPVARGLPLADQPASIDVPAGLPSSLLERRPDLMQAEAQLQAADAQVAAARALFFPRISLTGSSGLQSAGLTKLFASGAGGIWSGVAAATVPLFTAGRNHAQVDAAAARRQQAVVLYQQAVRQAFREVADALVAYGSARAARDAQVPLLTAARDARRLAELRYRGGVASYLEVLDADTRLFAAELGSAQTRQVELSAVASVYRALGGGWQPAP